MWGRELKLAATHEATSLKHETNYRLDDYVYIMYCSFVPFKQVYTEGFAESLTTGPSVDRDYWLEIYMDSSRIA